MSDLRTVISTSEDGAGADPAELVLFHALTPEKFFQEAERLGIPEEDLQDHQVRDRVFHSCLIAYRAATVQALSADVGIPVTEEQAHAIARNSLVPDVLTDPAPLTPDQRAIAEQLYSRAVRAAMARQGEAISDKVAMTNAKRIIRRGERGLTRLQKLPQATGCLVVLIGMLGLGAGLTLLLSHLT